jgi:hypothetical protein
MRIDEVAAWHVVELETDAFDKSVTSRGLTAEVSAYSRSRGATKDFSSGARGSLCFLRALDVGGGVSVFGYRLSFRKGSSVGSRLMAISGQWRRSHLPVRAEGRY